MQISLNHEQIRHFQNRFFKNINDVAKNEFEKASWYHSLYNHIGHEGFDSFLTQYFNYTPDQIKDGHEQVKYRQMFTSRRLWMRIGGMKGIKKLFSITDEEKRTKIVDRIMKPKGVVNYTMLDLDRMIKSDPVDMENVMFFDGYRQPQTKKRRNRKDHKDRKDETKQKDLLIKLNKSLNKLMNHQPRKRNRSHNHDRQPVMSR